ncbi:hypothetical protein ACQE3E_04245 [Methylomonas sp. MED-D]|uniref:Uncharacterized protein n=1 Tax=Methylomonas koyamae TaxID=702114 RepID=A0A177NU70_9GAMM|nr:MULTISPECIES: hypothetical protein [Methylomonas]NJA07216.1 hypothetical protein [Methylococcaceae bacterium WWC4]MDT4329882.1 hypothetical protein [Methylomonas sp. MV1]OAI21525.1 hypothetical protein A1355_23240 [Methylomonas koyamae]OHX38016.1 hypothetical protein BJL95_06965 [Methylomonas sp. LWB]WGS87000.1 hypothetical protein QC632_04420 [Methylomonas sp. UP202]
MTHNKISRQTNLRKRRYRSYGYARSALIIGGIALIVWLTFLLPLSFAVQASDGPVHNSLLVLRLMQYGFLAANACGMMLAATSLFKSPAKLELAIFGLTFNLVDFVLGLSLNT